MRRARSRQEVQAAAAAARTSAAQLLLALLGERQLLRGGHCLLWSLLQGVRHLPQPARQQLGLVGAVPLPWEEAGE